MAKQIVDKSSISIPEGTMEDFKRPSHPDFATSAELRDSKWSGIRHNSITTCCEIWLEGQVAKEVTAQMVELNVNAINDAITEVFSLHEVRPYIPELIAYKHSIETKG